jgi:uncharacterized protein YjbJ (UPF0337 family)
MTSLTAIGTWNIAKGKLKQKVARLVQDDLQYDEGKQDELTGRIQKRAGKGKENFEGATHGCCNCKHK